MKNGELAARFLADLSEATIREETTVMKKNEVKIGGVYVTKVSDKMAAVRITGVNPHGGWDAVNVDTNREVQIKSAQRLRRPVGKTAQDAATRNVAAKGAKKATKSSKDTTGDKAAPGANVGAPGSNVGPVAQTATQAPKATTEKPAGGMSGLDAAAKVLGEAGEPLNCREMVRRAFEKGYWKSDGKTPAATVYSAILREIQAKGNEARFRKTERGKFALAR
jgi:hypothetical protein